jgi:DNA-binding PadR family transcriptional regulator
MAALRRPESGHYPGAGRGEGAVMPQQCGPELSLAEWLVLCLVSERPMHGFAIACLLADDGSLGRVWHVRKMVVYRAAHRLEELGLIVASDRQPTSQGPARVPLQATSGGRQAAGEWLHRPAGHARDIRSELLLKMALLDRVGADPEDLVRAQRRQLAPIADALAGQIPATAGFDLVLLQWRYESVSATLRFLDALLATVPAPRTG